MGDKMWSTRINAALDRNARFWGPVLASRRGRAAVGVGVLASIVYLYALRSIIQFATIGAAYVFGTLLPGDPAMQQYAWMQSVYLANLWIVMLLPCGLVIGGGLSVLLAGITGSLRAGEEA